MKIWRLRRISALILVFGLSTSFLPLFRVSAPVASKLNWSTWDLARHVYSLNLPGMEIFFNRSLVGLAVAYVLMLCGLALIFLPRPQKGLVTISVIGSIAGYEPFYWGHQDFGRLLLVATKAGIDYQPAIYILIPVMPALLCVSLNKSWTVDQGRS